MISASLNSALRFSTMRRLFLAILTLLFLTGFGAGELPAADPPQIMPLNQVKPGMHGVAHTIFSGNQIEKFDLEVIDVVPNLLGPKQSIILVQLRGEKVEHTGVVAGMSGSPVYIDGKLVGALSLKFGSFSKEAIGGVTPIEDILALPTGKTPPAAVSAQDRSKAEWTGYSQTVAAQPTAAGAGSSALPRYSLPNQWAQSMGSGAFLEPIASPLTFAGFSPSTIRQYAAEWLPYGMIATPGGMGTPQADDADIVAGDMVSMVLAGGDLSMQAACTVTAVIEDRIYACGHPLFSVGNTQMPLARGRVVTTLASNFESTKMVTAGGIIGTLTQDRLTSVMGRIGPAPRMIPVDLTVVTPDGERQFHVQVMSDSKLTPALIGIVTFNGLTQNTAYGEGNTMRLSGSIDMTGHPSVSLENMYAPTDQFIPDGTFVATNIQGIFSRIFSNPYETPEISRVSLRVESVPERRIAVIENAWSETSEADPGDTVTVKVMLRPYRGAPILRDVPITIPPQAARGTTLRVQVSDSDSLNRVRNQVASQGRLGGIEQLIALLNRERHNNRVYVTLYKPTPTLMVQDKELTDAPLSEINVLNQRRLPSNITLLRESMSGEWSVPMDQVIAGTASVFIRVK